MAVRHNICRSELMGPKGILTYTSQPIKLSPGTTAGSIALGFRCHKGTHKAQRIWWLWRCTPDGRLWLLLWLEDTLAAVHIHSVRRHRWQSGSFHGRDTDPELSWTLSLSLGCIGVATCPTVQQRCGDLLYFMRQSLTHLAELIAGHYSMVVP